MAQHGTVDLVGPVVLRDATHLLLKVTIRVPDGGSDKIRTSDNERRKYNGLVSDLEKE